MCTCASCSHTDSFTGKGFAAWPRGEPAGKRSSEAAYRAHVAHSRQWGRGYDGVMHEPREVPVNASTAGTRGSPERLKIPGARWERKGYHGERVYIPAPESMAEYIAEFDRLNGLVTAEKVKKRADYRAMVEREEAANRKRQEPVKAPARPATPGKAPQHFPEPDRRPETVTSLPHAYRIHSSANDTEEHGMRYMTVAQAAEAWDASQPRVRQWLADGRIRGAQKVGRDWLIPATAERPKPAKPGQLQASRR